MENYSTPEIIVPAPRALHSLEHTLAAIVGNCAAGLGAGCVLAVGLWMLGAIWPTILQWAVGCAVGMAGALIWLYFARDDLRNALRWRDLQGDLSAAEAAIAEGDEEIERLRSKLVEAVRTHSRLSAEVAALRAGRSYVHALPLPSTTARQDAEAMIRFYHTQRAHPDRRTMQAYGLSGERHRAAQTLLIAAGVLRIGRGNVVQWTDATAAEALARLAGAGNTSQPAVE